MGIKLFFQLFQYVEHSESLVGLSPGTTLVLSIREVENPECFAIASALRDTPRLCLSVQGRLFPDSGMRLIGDSEWTPGKRIILASVAYGMRGANNDVQYFRRDSETARREGWQSLPGRPSLARRRRPAKTAILPPPAYEHSLGLVCPRSDV